MTTHAEQNKILMNNFVEKHMLQVQHLTKFQDKHFPML